MTIKISIIRARNIFLGWLYRRVMKPILFLHDPERIHDYAIRLGRAMGTFPGGKILCRAFFGYQAPPLLRQTIGGIDFDNPIGLAAGFDKNARLTPILGYIGFGHMEVGSVTGKQCDGNPKPRLWRIPEHQALRVYYGLYNDGADAISSRLAHQIRSIPLGISIAKTNCKDTAGIEGAITDYAHSYRQLLPLADYLTINISCPNAFGGDLFTSHPDKLDQLLSTLNVLEADKPIFLKISPDVSLDTLADIVRVGQTHGVTGFICSNSTKQSDMMATFPGQGGISGRPVFAKSNQHIAEIYRLTKGSVTIIGCGGVFSAADAYEKIKHGASLIQLISGMIYQGPSLISDITLGLTDLLTKDGYTSITDAVGAYHRT